MHSKNKISSAIIKWIIHECDRLANWQTNLSVQEQMQLTSSKKRFNQIKFSYLDAYYRICHTTPLILETITALHWKEEHDAIQFWTEHLQEEVSHDKIMKKDLIFIFGSEKKIMLQPTITPPSSALLGYFYWQAYKGNPHLLILFRLFLEYSMSHFKHSIANIAKTLSHRATKSLKLHTELDSEHSHECLIYIDSYFHSDDIPNLKSLITFISQQLIESQIWITRVWQKKS